MSELVEQLREILRRPFKEADRVYIAKAADENERLDGLREQAEFVINTLESNARIQAKLLADTGRELARRTDALSKIHCQAARYAFATDDSECCRMLENITKISDIALTGGK